MNKLRTVKLNELAAPGRSIISGPFGSNIGQRFFQDVGVPVIRGNNLTTDFKKFNDEGFVFLSEEKANELKADAIRGDILFTAAGTIGQVGMIPQSSKYDRYVISNKQLRLRIDPEKADPNYVYYWLASPWIYKTIVDRNTGSTVPLINLGIIKTLPIVLPEDIFEQKKISKIFSLIDKKIDLNNHINTELEAMAKTLYDYWFVQFDFPDANGKPYKTSGGKMVYNSILKREIPEGWGISRVGSVTKIELGGTPSTKVDSYWENANIPWLSSTETASFPVVSAEQMVTQSGIDNSAATLLPKGTVVISIVRYIRPSILGLDAATNQSVVGIRENENLKNSFIYPYFCNEVPRLMGLRGGAQQPHINKGTIDDSPIVIPSSDILESYYKIADPLYKEIINLAFQNNELTKLRDWILPMLMNGQITVR
ncbi:restriction endonuclease subunit S [Arsenophonus nasoniae]|uniref:Restriction endonuclease subunit S n=1 Tax=Arsenophonus nasoniae TaxID=638 RepID=A0AA95GMW5_9GAMM|nr:restriction endonuclease subunit S [Arsenophonus nasoniae]WGM01812.1 restriction endonuclease subunit S [Arsenophonus nasoniae]